MRTALRRSTHQRRCSAFLMSRPAITELDHQSIELADHTHTSSAVHLRSSLRYSPDRVEPDLFPTRSPPRLLSAAAVGGLKPAPVHRLRGARPHLSCSLATRSNRFVRAPSWHTIVGVSREPVPSTLQLPVQLIENHVGQHRRQRPPCGTPCSRGSTRPPTHIPALTMRRISLSSATSGTWRASLLRSLSWLTRSKKLSRSRSTTQAKPDLPCCCIRRTAWCAERCGRKP